MATGTGNGEVNQKAANPKNKILVYDKTAFEEIWKDIRLTTSVSSKSLSEADHNGGKNFDTNQMESLSLSDDASVEKLVCQSCAISFENKDDYRRHYRLDWHRFNLKAKIRGRATITEDQFDQLEDDISSISGSDSSSEDNEEEKMSNQKGDPKLIIQNSLGQYMALYKCLLYPKKNKPESETKLQDLIEKLPALKTWSFIMLGGGHFAAAIFNGPDVICHKTFHSYTVRAKQGGSQSSRDNKSGGGTHPRSAGASLRRYNEAAFNQHVRDTMDLWKAELDRCQLIFYRAVSSNQNIIFGGKNPLFLRSDPRLRSIPFPTRRATFKEVLRVRQILATIEILDESFLEKMREETRKKTVEKSTRTAEIRDVIESDESDVPEEYLLDEVPGLNENLSKKTKKKKKKKEKAKTSEKSPEELLEVELFPGEKEMRTDLLEICNGGTAAQFDAKINHLKDILFNHFADCNNLLKDFLNQRIDSDCSTILHKAAINNNGEIVWKLLETGSDPSLPDAFGKMAYISAGNKETRNVFRRFMGTYPDRYDYSKAQIPSALTDEAEAERAKRLAEKRKQQREQRKEKKAEERKIEEEKKKQEEERKKQEEEKRRFLALSDREKRALAAERRLLAAASSAGSEKPVLVRCFVCGEDISGKVPFDYSGNKFCTTQCLQARRKANLQRNL